MKKKLWICILALLSLNSKAQMQDLAGLSIGKITTFEPFYKDKSLFGYLAVYDLGEINETTKKFEYIILDKNLNKMANKEFETSINVGGYHRVRMDFKDQIILESYVRSDQKINIFALGKLFVPNKKRILLKTNEIKDLENLEYKDNEFVEVVQGNTLGDYRKLYKENRKEDKEKGFSYASYITELKYGGYLVEDDERHKGVYKNENIIRFDENKKELWRISYNKDATKKKYEKYRLLGFDETYVYYLNTQINNKEEKSKILVIGLNDGGIKKEKQITELSNESILNIRYIQKEIPNNQAFEDTYVISAKLRDRKYHELGFYRMLVDKKTLDISFKNILWKEDVSKFIDVNERGGVEKGYRLELRDLFFLKDGGIVFLTEKYKAGGQYGTTKNTDMVVIYTDKDFKVKFVKTLEKEKNKHSSTDYLFSQYLDDKNGVIFFYQDYQKDEDKEKKWNLFINAMKNGNFSQEKIQISSKKNKYVIFPYPAKEGYVLLREYNEKDKYNQIRLEKLNY